MANILIVDDEQEIGRFLTRLFQLRNMNVTYIDSGRAFDRLKRLEQFDAAFLDVRLPDRNGLDLLKKLKKQAPLCKAVVMTGYSTVKMAVEAIQLGAEDFLEKPFEDIQLIEELASRLTEQADKEEYLLAAGGEGIFLGTSPAMHELYRLAHKLASKQVTILIEGETGTGKERLAEFLHRAGSRAEKPFIGLNCGALSESLLESELFGHAKGAFTGAAFDRAGYFEAASSGTLFLDEIAEASPSTQVKLLRVLETGEFFKIGDSAPKRTGARIIAASHANLEESVREGSFREDLLYRLDIVKLRIPPLRERQQDIPAFIDRHARQYGLTFSFSPEAMNAFKQYRWPGNMRELVNTLQRLGVLYADEPVITPSMLPEKMLRPGAAPKIGQSNSTGSFHAEWSCFSDELIELYNSDEPLELDRLLHTMKRMEKRAAEAFIRKTLKETAGCREQAAKKLGISKRKIRYYLNET
ncbi:sigma-54-dependent transcriptional regulator [Domibacillus indicus]|uniref:sigma-54-dependent transcriptional regulator n=1 Tax=Domibacillus indicus TaxID=1437523 RepID=UPI000617C7AA|nr:sigma-54 dependent transcriptional regulator [Domibacillus indicus]